MNNKSFVVIMIVMGVIILGLIAFIFAKPEGGIFTKSNTEVGSQNNTLITKDPIKDVTSLTTLNKYNDYFNVNNLINKYYDYMESNDSTVIDLIDDDYKNSNNINSNNAVSIKDYNDINYISKQIIYRSKNNILYFFVNGELQVYSNITQELNEKENVMHLVIIDNNNKTFSITPFSSKTLLEYANNYDLKDSKKIGANNNNVYVSHTYTDQDITEYYINYFKSLLYLNTEKAYNMLAPTYKNTYVDLEDFTNHLAELVNKIPSSLLSFSVSGNDGNRRYIAICTNEQRVEFYETSIMNFTISLV